MTVLGALVGGLFAWRSRRLAANERRLPPRR
jgi:hypothetical protein